MTHATLFSGIGAAEIAARSLGWTNIFNCDNNQFTQRVLKYHFPDAIQYGFNIQAANFTVWRHKVDVLTGGFPCQPFSQAGKRKGTDDERYLWGEFLRVIEEVQPRWVVGENVLGIVSWSKGLVFEQVCADLEAKGYEVTPYILPAAGVAAPHQRYRVFFVAYRTDPRTQSVQQWQNRVYGFGVASDTDSPRVRTSENETFENGSTNSKQWQHPFGRTSGLSNNRITADAKSERRRVRWANGNIEAHRTPKRTSICEQSARPCKIGITPNTPRQQSERLQSEQREISEPEQGEFRRGDSADCHTDNWSNFPTQPPVCSRDDGFSSRLDTATILNGKRLTQAKWREESIKAYGNAIVPQVLHKIYTAIELFKNQAAND